MADMSLAEVTRWVDRHDRKHDDVVSKEVHDQIIKTLSEDITEIKESQRWAMRLIVTLFLTNLVGLLYFLATQAPG